MAPTIEELKKHWEPGVTTDSFAWDVMEHAWFEYSRSLRKPRSNGPGRHPQWEPKKGVESVNQRVFFAFWREWSDMIIEMTYEASPWLEVPYLGKFVIIYGSTDNNWRPVKPHARIPYRTYNNYSGDRAYEIRWEHNLQSVTSHWYKSYTNGRFKKNLYDKIKKMELESYARKERNIFSFNSKEMDTYNEIYEKRNNSQA